ncbi:inversin-like [Belonocnema kinseyi]|uniref:inversin-like n=1 Tax=Belonocnema kinseyi TaxID=2817044 RepID=UPI00143DD871|nr:inversin-like [Belonocnema kinseyi]
MTDASVSVYLESTDLTMEHEYNIDDENASEARENKDTIIYHKIKTGSVKDVENLLKRGVSAKTSFRGLSLLHSAVEYNAQSIYSRKKSSFLRIAELLLDYGADFNNIDMHNRTPLHLALLHGDLEMVQVLLNKRLKSIDKKKGDLFFDDFLEQSQNIVDFLLKNGTDCKISKKEYPILLEFAAKNGDEKSFENILMTKGEFDINYLPPFPGSTVLHTIIEKGTCKMIKDFVNHGADINKKDRCGNNPLQSAIKLGRFLQVGCLLKCGASVFDSDAKGDTALHLAARSRADTEMIEMILSKGIDVNVRNSINNETPLHLACGQDIKTVKNFLKNGAELNVKNFLGKTPFHRACAAGNFEVVSYLIEIGVDINATGYENRNALHCAIIIRKEINVIRILLLKGIDVNARDIHGKTPLHYIGNKITREDLLIMKLLIKYGADVNAKDKQGSSPLHEVSKTPGFHHLMEYFFEIKADVNAQNINGETPLSYILHIGFFPYNFHCLPNNMKSLVLHLCKMIALKLHVCEKNLDSLKHKVLFDLYRACNLEIDNMKEKICNRNISMFDFLLKDLTKLAAFVRNEEILETLNSYSYADAFPNYGQILERKIEEAKKRACLLKRTVYIFNDCLKAKLPDLALDKICEYLEETELSCFVDAFSIREKILNKGIHVYNPLDHVYSLLVQVGSAQAAKTTLNFAPAPLFKLDSSGSFSSNSILRCLVLSCLEHCSVPVNAIMKWCYVCEKCDGKVLEFSDESLQKCINVVAFRKEKKYKYGDLRLSEESRNEFGYHRNCNGKVTVIKQKDRGDFEAFLQEKRNPKTACHNKSDEVSVKQESEQAQIDGEDDSHALEQKEIGTNINSGTQEKNQNKLLGHCVIYSERNRKGFERSKWSGTRRKSSERPRKTSET